jgi:acetoin utilization protein AcuB
MDVNMWMTRDPVTVESHTTIIEAAALMSRKNIRRLPVVEGQAPGRLLGMVSATDIFRAFPPNVNPFSAIPPTTQVSAMVKDIMSAPAITTEPEAPIEEVARIMREQKISALPVLRDGKLMGLITESDIFRVFVDCFQLRPGAVRITFDTSKGEDIFELIAREARLRGLSVVSLMTRQHDDHRVCIVQVAGSEIDAFVNDLWKSGHHVLNVLRGR